MAEDNTSYSFSGSLSGDSDNTSSTSSTASTTAAVSGISGITKLDFKNLATDVKSITQSASTNTSYLKVISDYIKMKAEQRLSPSDTESNLIENSAQLLTATLTSQGYLKSIADQLKNQVIGGTIKFDEQQWNESKKDAKETEKLTSNNISSFRDIADLFMQGGFALKARGFNSAFKVVARGINAGMIIIAKSSHLVDKASDVITRVVVKIGDAIQDFDSKKLMQIAGAIALFGLSIAAFGLVMLTPGVLILPLALMGLAAITHLFAKNVGKEMLMIAGAIALFGLAIWGISQIVTLDSILPVAIAIGLLAGAMWLFNRVGGQAPKSLLLATVSIAALGLAMWLWKPVKLEDVGVMGATLVAMGIGLAILGAIPNALGGAIALGSGAIALGLLGIAVRIFPKNTGLDYTMIGLFVLGIGATMALAGTVAPLILAGAAALAVAGGATMILGLSLGLISALTIKPEQISNFAQSIKLLALGYIQMIPGPLDILKIAAAMVIVGPMALVTLMAAAAIAAVTLLPAADPKKIDAFGFAITSLSGVYQRVVPSISGGLKLAAGLLLVTGIAAVTLVAGTAISLFSLLAAKPKSIESAVSGMDIFISGMTEVLIKNQPKFDQLNTSFLKFAGVGTLIADLATGVNAIGNMQFSEYKVVNGRLVLYKTRKFTDQDFTNAGVSVGKIISALIGPLSEIGSQKDTISIGGFKISNPFSNKVKKGMETLQHIGSVFKPISELIASFKKDGDNVIDEKYIGNINVSIRTLLTGLSTTIMQLEKDGTMKYFVSTNSALVRGLNTVFKTIGGINSGELSKTAQIIDEVFKKIHDQSAYDKLLKNLGKIRKEAKLIKTEVNGFDIRRLTMFNEITKNLLLASKDNNMTKLIEEIRKLVGTLEQQKQGYTQPQSQPYLAPQPVQQAAPIVTQKIALPGTPPPDKPIQVVIQDMINDLLTAINQMSVKFDTPLAVKVTNIKTMY